MATKRAGDPDNTAGGSSATAASMMVTDNMDMDDSIELYMIGDSDIARWPKDLLPSIPGAEAASDVRVRVHGRSGATMGYVAQMAAEICNNDNDTNDNDTNDNDTTTNTTRTRTHCSLLLNKRPSQSRLRIVIGCAGENDGGQGIQVDATLDSFGQFLQSVMRTQGGASAMNDNGNARNGSTSTLLLFLGPKLEPWMAGDAAAYKQYAKLSRGLKRVCNKYNQESDTRLGATEILTQQQQSQQGQGHIPIPTTIPISSSIPNIHVYYMDCLTMFCLPATIDVPGAIMGCKAVADYMYFDHDYLHLNHKGYAWWRHHLEPLLAYAAEHGSWPADTRS
jgi:lysophospholipase L1-like esterase